VSFGNLLRPPRHLLLLFLALTLLPAMALVWAGWQLIEQDKNLEQQSIEKRQNDATGLIATALQQQIVETRQRLANTSAWQSTATDDAFIIAVNPESIQTIPETHLLYYPVQPSLPEAPEDIFSDGEDKAIDKLRELTKSPDSAIRAGADLRLAKFLRNNGQPAAALDVYADLVKQTGVAVASGNPADLVARLARCGLLAELNRTNELRHEAQLLDADLRSSRWQLDEGRFGAAMWDMAAWLGTDPSRNVERETLPQEVDSLWKQLQGAHDPGTFSGSKSVRIGNQFSTLIWTGASDHLVVLVAGPHYLERAWLSAIQNFLKSQNMRFALQDSDGRAIFGDPITGGPAIQRTLSETGLPWTLQVASRDSDTDRAQSVKRRGLYLACLSVLLAVVAAGSYFVGRAVTRELAVARLQSDFVAAVSHEFRTPLTSLRQVTELLSDGRHPDAARLPSYYQAQTRATERLQRLVESLLDFGRMEAGVKPYRMQRLDVSEWARSVVKESQEDGAMGGCEIEFQTHCDNGNAANIQADPEALARALRNLVDNAVKYSPDCRTVWIEVERRGNRVAISVRDQGLGIPANERKQIFRKFVRGAASKTNGIKGTGVGLAMVKQIVEAHGGDIQLESEPGKGSTFTILLPGLPVGAVCDRARSGA